VVGNILAALCRAFAERLLPVTTRIYLTGRIAAEHDGSVRVDERDLPGRQGRLAFAYLVAHRHRPTRRDDLIDVLWGQQPPQEYEVTCSAVLSRLRALLRKAALAGAAIEAEHGSVSLRLPSDTWVDIEASGNAIDICEGELRRGDRANAWGHANVAIAIARRPFLPGEEAPWIEGWRAKLTATLVRALHGLITISAANGEPAVAIQHAEEILQIEPFRETAYQDLMRLHGGMGNRAEALRVFARCQNLLRSELGTTPSPETEGVWRAIAAKI
jgi:SARP family transcriptional regulator, regulator of embCAB operon